MKTCSACKEIKELDMFYYIRASSPELGRRKQCKECVLAFCREHDKLKSQNKPTRRYRFKTENPETQICKKCGIEKNISVFFYEGEKLKPKARCKACNTEARVKANSIRLGREWRHSDKYKAKLNKNKVCTKCLKEMSVECFNINRSGPKKGKRFSWCKRCDNEKRKQIRDKNKTKDSEKRKIRRKNDVNYRLRLIIRSRLHAAIVKGKKSDLTITLLGCSTLEYKRYLESKFKPGMSWQNHGRRGWHIDHIKPCASFNLADEKEQMQCFHYTNTQPLWWKENLVKNRFEVKA